MKNKRKIVNGQSKWSKLSPLTFEVVGLNLRMTTLCVECRRLDMYPGPPRLPLMGTQLDISTQVHGVLNWSTFVSDVYEYGYFVTVIGYNHTSYLAHYM